MNDFSVKFADGRTGTVRADRFTVNDNGCLVFYNNSKTNEEPIIVRVFNRDVWNSAGWL